MERLKLLIYKTLQKHAFIAIFLLASVKSFLGSNHCFYQIPNPLFDLAGFLCGHFLVPFSVFFGAAFLGKAIVKVSIQSFFVIFCFSQHQVEIILKGLHAVNPKLQELASNAINKQKNTLFSDKVSNEGRPLVAQLWEYFVMAMVAYFVYSIINSLVQNYLQEEKESLAEIKPQKGKKTKRE